jgi:hypothetical protein
VRPRGWVVVVGSDDPSSPAQSIGEQLGRVLVDHPNEHAEVTIAVGPPNPQRWIERLAPLSAPGPVVIVLTAATWPSLSRRTERALRSASIVYVADSSAIPHPPRVAGRPVVRLATHGASLTAAAAQSLVRSCTELSGSPVPGAHRTSAPPRVRGVDTTTVLRCADGLLTRTVGDRTLVLDVDDDGPVRTCDPVTSAVLEALADGGSVEDLVDDDAERPQLLDALMPSVHRLVELGWLIPAAEELEAPQRRARPPAPWNVVTDVADRLAALPADDDVDQWVGRVAYHRISALARWRHGDVHERLDAAAVGAMDGALRIERSAVRLARLLRACDIDFAILKGAATARLDYPDPSVREFGDVDVLIHEHDVERLDRLVADAALTIEPVRTGSRTMIKARSFRDAFGVEVDVHHRLLDDPFGRAISTDDLLEDLDWFLVGNEWLPALSRPRRLAHAIAHATASASQHRRHSSLADIVVLAASPTTCGEAIRQLGSWSLGALVGRLDAAAGVDDALWQPPDRRRVLGAVHRRALDGSARAREIATIASIGSPAAVAGHLRLRLAPPSELLADGGETRAGRLRRALLDNRPRVR